MLRNSPNICNMATLLVGVVAAGASLHTQAADLANGWSPGPLEVAKLPEYCQTWFNKRLTPPNCDGVHHLCAGKVLINRTMDYSIPKRERQRIFRMAKQEVDYIFTRQNPNCAMMGEARATQSMIRTLEPILR
jgi:hypothetical protein